MGTKIKFYLLRWSEALSLIAVAASIGTIAYVSVTHDDAARNDVPSLAVCEEEDGSTQGACWFYDDDHGRWILNVDHGRVTYVPDTGSLTQF